MRKEIDKKEARTGLPAALEKYVLQGEAHSILGTDSHPSQPSSQTPPQRALGPHPPTLFLAFPKLLTQDPPECFSFLMLL